MSVWRKLIIACTVPYYVRQLRHTRTVHIDVQVQDASGSQMIRRCWIRSGNRRIQLPGSMGDCGLPNGPTNLTLLVRAVRGF